MGALAIAKEKGKEQVIEILRAVNLREYGIYNQSVVDHWLEVVRIGETHGKPTKVVGALNNSDMEGILLEILMKEPEKVMEGLSVAAYMMGIDDKVLHLPLYANGIISEIKDIADIYGVQIVQGMVDVREEKNSLLNHIVTLKELSDCLEGCFEEGIYISVDGTELRKVAVDILVKDLVDMEDIKAFEVGYRIWTPDAILDRSIKEVDISNGKLQSILNTECLVHKTEESLRTYRKESCGKCVFCREGLIQLEGMVKDMTLGKGKMENLPVIKEIGEAMAYSNLCTIGQVSADIVLSALENFAPEFEEHIKKKHCNASICSAFNRIYIDPKLCTGCGECIDICPEDCIEGKVNFIHMIDDFDCTKCGKCIEVCEEEAIIRTSERAPKLPKRLTKCGRFKR